MKATGVVRKIDGVGRLVIPREMMKSLGINNGDSIEFWVSAEGNIMLKKYEPSINVLEQIGIIEEVIRNDNSYEPKRLDEIIKLLNNVKEII